MTPQFEMNHDINMQKIINEEINKDGIYEAYVQAVIDNDYTKALKLNRELCQRVSKICSESIGERKEQAGLRLELLEKTAKDIQTKIDRL